MANQKTSVRNRIRVPLIRVFISALFISGVISILIIPIYQKGQTEQKGVGEVSTEDIHAPYTLTYESEILTKNAKDLAVANVDQVYYPVDPSIARQQIERLQTILNYINLIRNDSFANQDQKVSDIEAVPELSLNEQRILDLLNLSANDWQLLQQESVIVLEQVMRNTIREGATQSALAEIPRLISYTLNESLANLLAELIQPLIRANSLYNEEATEEAFQTARENVNAITTTYVTGQTIISNGEVITPLVWEALNNYKLLQTSDTTRDMLSAGIFGLIIALSFVAFLNSQIDTPVKDVLGFALLLGFFLVYFLIARLAIPDRTVLPYLFPIAGFGLAIGGLYSMNIAIV